MKRPFTTVDDDQALDLTVRLGDGLPPNHLARFVVDSVAQRDLSARSAHSGTCGGEPSASEVMLGLLLSGSATGVFSSRAIERATSEAVPFRFLAGTLHPDHETLATCRRPFLPELKNLFVQVLVLAQEAGVLKLGTISLDGTKIHADASKQNAVSDTRLLEVEAQRRSEVEEVFALSEQSDQPEVPDGLVVRDEIARRENRLARRAVATAVLQARAVERTAEEQAQRAERERTTGRRPGGRPPTPPVPGPRDGDQDTGTDPESRIRKHPTDAGVEQDDNAQVAVDQGRLLIVGWALSHHPNDRHEAEPPLEAIPSALGTPEAAALDTGSIGPATLAAGAKRTSEPSIATGRDPHHPSWQQRFAPLPDPPPQDASAQVTMADTLRTALGKAIDGARTCTVEPVIGSITEGLGFRPFSLRGISAAAGEWCLVCVAFTLTRFHPVS
jgi:transposase